MINTLSDPTALQIRWLYRRHELVLGPVGTEQLIEHLYSGEVTAKTEVSPLGSNQYTKLGDIDAFRLHLAKAEAKLRVEATARVEEGKKARGRRARWVSFAVMGLLVAGGAAYLARYLAVHRPWAAPDPLADLDFGIEAPKIAIAKAGGGEELVDYPMGGNNPTTKTGRKAGRNPGGALTPLASKGVTTGPDGMEIAQFDKSSINDVIQAKQPTLRGCFVDEVRRNPSFAAKIPIEFAIGNNGKVSKLWVDHPSYKEGPLADCLLKELQKWPFHPYEGEQAVVGLSFRIGKSS